MGKTTYTEQTARMFVALDLPARIREDIDDWGRGALRDPAFRRVVPDSLHITLAFLGDRPLGEVERIEYAMEEIAHFPILLELQAPVGRPDRVRPRVVALPVGKGPVPARQAELIEVLAMEGIAVPAEQRFWPHVTVARVRNEGAGSRQPTRVEVPGGPSPTAGTGWFEAVRVSLYRSELQPDRAHYTPLAQVELPCRGGSEVI